MGFYLTGADIGVILHRRVTHAPDPHKIGFRYEFLLAPTGGPLGTQKQPSISGYLHKQRYGL
jgi:hypothetical protein